MTEIIGWAVDHEMNGFFFWVFLDVINLLRAVFVFIIFICQKTVLQKIREHFQYTTGRLRWSRSTTATDAISLSTVGPSRKASRSGSDGPDQKLASRQFKEKLEQTLCTKHVSPVKEAEEPEDAELLAMDESVREKLRDSDE